MKRNVLLSAMVILMCGAGMVKAQRPVGDTITGEDSTLFYYIYNWHRIEKEWGVWANYFLVANMNELLATDPNQEMTPYGNINPLIGNVIRGVQMYTDRPLKVVGIAAPAYMQEPRDTAYHTSSPLPPRQLWNELNTVDTTLAGRATDSMILYKPVEGGNLVKLMDGPWRIENPHRYIVLPPRLGSPVNNYWKVYYIDSSATSYTAPLYEVMFEKPVVVEDSFVVAITAFNNEGHKRWVYDYRENRYFMWLWDHNPTRTFEFYSFDSIPIPGRILWRKFRSLPWERTVIDTFRTNAGKYYFIAPIVLPIIEPGFDTTLCHEVSNLRVAERGAGCATLMWDAGDGGPWIVAYGKTYDAWEDFTFDTVSSPMTTLTGLEVGTQYLAVVRGYCNVTHEYGEWTSPLEVEIYQQGHDRDPEGIGHPGDLGRFTRLIPNPAHGVVNVVSSFRLSRIELYALDGRKVLEQAADGISTMVDVSGLPSGTYIAALYLPHGVATKKLVVGD